MSNNAGGPTDTNSSGDLKNDMELLKPYVSSTTEDIFVLKGLNGIVGPAYARYSRAKGGVREVLLNEFIKDGAIDPKHADQLIQRVLIAYGDDSVGELEGAHLSFEKISVLQTKDIEDRRIGGSPIEQSTRYVFYDQKDAQGNWLYYRGPEVVTSSFGKQYIETMDFIFDTYSSLVEPMQEYFKKLKPMEDAEYDINGDQIKEKYSQLTDEKEQKSFRMTYNMDIRTKACDTLRSLLPLATKTNVGLFGNGRYYQELLSYLWTTELAESHNSAVKAKAALDDVIPQYVKRAKRRDYNAGINESMYALAKELFGHVSPAQATEPQYSLLERGGKMIEELQGKGVNTEDAITEVQYLYTLAAMIFPYSNLSLTQLRELISAAGEEVQQKIWNTYLGERVTRRDRPGRAFEDGYPYTFNLVTNFGVYKDLERHRMNTQQRQIFTTKLGYEIPSEIEEIGATEQFKECFAKADALYDLIAAINPLQAQYAVMHAHYVQWSLGINDRALMHLIELRSTPQGHPQYRVAVQKMHDLVMARDKRRGEAMKFADHNDYYWSRADSEAKQRVKEARLDEKMDQN